MYRGLMGRRPLGVALEEELPAEGEVISAEPGVDQLEQDLLETSEDLGEGVENDAQVDEAQAASGEIEDAVEVAEASEEKGGLDTVAAESLRILVNSACRRAGISSSGSMPAMESFGQAGRRLSNTRIACEDWKDKIKEIWQKIVAALKRAWEWVMGYWNKFFGSAEKLKKRAEALEKRAKDTTGAPEGELKNLSLAKAIAIGGKPADPGVVGTQMGMLEKLIEEQKTKVQTVVNSASDLAARAEKPDELKNYEYKGLMGGSAGDAYGSAKEGWGYAVNAELLGGMTDVTYGPKVKPSNGSEALEAEGRASFSIAPFGGKLKEVDQDELKIAKPGEAEEIAHGAIKVADAAISFRDSTKKLGDALKKISDAATKAANRAEKEKPEGDAAAQAGQKANKEILKAYKEAVAGQTKRLATDPAKVVTFAVRAAAAAVQYGEASMAKYKK